MSRFKRIKNKSNKKSSVSIDEKIAALNKELEKTGMLSEGPTMTTSNIYPEVSEVQNPDLSNFEAIMTGGERLGFSGADGNTAGNASLGDAQGLTGVALSPPHPVTGVRINAVHVTTGLGDTTPLRPGVTISRGFSDNPPQYTMGSVLWFYDMDFDNGAGQPAGKWCNLEYSNFDDTAGQWFFWDTIKSGQFAGVYVVNTDLSQHPCGDISDLIDGLNFPNGSLGPPKIPLLTVKGLETEPIYPGPIAQLFGLGQRAFNWLLNRITTAPERWENRIQSIGMPIEISTSVNENKPVNAPEPSDAEKQEYFDNLDPHLIFDPNNPYNVQTIGGVTGGIPVNDDKQNYADENIYVNENGDVQSNIGPNGEKEYYEKNNTAPASEGSTIGSRGQAQAQVYWNEEKGKWMYSYHDHAYHNINSTDTDETDWVADIGSWISHKDSDTKHGRTEGSWNSPDNTSPNTGGMSGYPCNSTACIRGDSVMTWEIPVEEIPNEEIRNKINAEIESGKTTNESYVSESAKLGHFEPDILNVDIKDIRKGIMPEYPKQPPAEMIDGYHQKSPLRPKPLDNEPYVKITKVDLIRNHRIKPSEVDEMMDTINRLNDYIKKHPEDLIYVQQRYPKDDPRLAELNWKMDQMLKAGEEYMDSNFKENKKLFNRAMDRTKNNIKVTDPKYVQQKYDELRGTIKPKKTKLVGRLSKHLNKYESKSLFKHVNSKDFKKISERKLEKEKFLEKQEQERLDYINDINAEMDEFRCDWRKDISESDFTNITKGNRIGQTFQHVSGATITLDNTMSDPSDQPSQVTLDLGFGEKITVDAPSGNEYGIAGVTKPLDKKVMQKQSVKTAEEINDQIEASEKASKSKSARVPVETGDLGYKSTDQILAEVGDQWTYLEYMSMLDAIADKAAAAEEPIAKAIAEYSPTGSTPGDVPISLIDAQEAITNARNKAEQALHQAWERYNKVPDLPDGGEEPIAKSRRSNYTSQEIAQNRENLKNSIITTATGVIDGARNLNRVNHALNLAKRENVKSGGSTQITTIPPDSLGGRNNPVETKMHFQSKKAFVKSVDLNNIDYDIASQIVDNSADAAQYALGFKAVHSQIPTEGGSQENNVKLNSKGDLEMFDNYAFRPDGYMDTGIAKVAKFFGGTELQKDAATLLDKAGPVGWLSHALLGDIPDRQDPPVRIKTTITKKELIQILGVEDYKIFVNRMKKERKKRKVNESTAFSKIKKFRNKY